MVNKGKIKEAVTLLLEGIGEDIQREGLLDTPDRIARMYEEIFAGMDQTSAEHLKKTFTAGNSMTTVYFIKDHRRRKTASFYSPCTYSKSGACISGRAYNRT